MRKTAVNLAIAGMAVAGASAMLPAQAATAAPSTQQETSTFQTTAAAPAYHRGQKLYVQAPRNRLKAWASIRDVTPSDDRVAVQTRIQRRDRGRWHNVVTGPRRVGNNYAKSVIRLRSCTNGKVYRLRVDYNYKGNQFRKFSPTSGGFRC